jgi:hypothetical protein
MDNSEKYKIDILLKKAIPTSFRSSFRKIVCSEFEFHNRVQK